MQEILIIVLITAVMLTVWGIWQVFEKVGRSGWKAVVPLYNFYILLRITGYSSWWILSYIWLITIWPLYYILLPHVMCPARDVSCQESVGWFLTELLQSVLNIFRPKFWTESLRMVGFNLIFWLILYGVPILSIVLIWRVLQNVSDRFERGVLFSLGLLFLPFIFWPILGLGSAEYQEGGQ
jgi:hypothetical protein